MPIPKDLREFVECLNASKVDYLIVGAIAVSWHGFPRFSADIDFLVRPTRENAERLVNAIDRFGMSSLGLTPEDFLQVENVVQLGVQPNRIDLLTSITGVSFEDAWQSRVSAELEGLAVEIIGVEQLLLNKDSTGRPKDRIDAEELRRLQAVD